VSRPEARSSTAACTSGWSSRPRRLPAMLHAWHGGEAISPRVRPMKGQVGYIATSVRMVNCPAAARALHAHWSHFSPTSRTPMTCSALLQPPGPFCRQSLCSSARCRFE
jgi:hypothetical protein